MTPQYLFAPFIPLPNVVFFPRSLLKLHIFEPRYRKLVAGALKGDRLIGVALLRPGWERAYYDAPPVHRIMGVGRIVEHERLPNGNYNVWLSGLERAEIIYEIQDKPFRVAKIRTMRDDYHLGQAAPLMEARRDLRQVCERLRPLDAALGEQLRKAIDEHVYPGAMADAVTVALSPGIYERQCILSETDLARRVRLVGVQARQRLYELEMEQAAGRQTDSDAPTSSPTIGRETQG